MGGGSVVTDDIYRFISLQFSGTKAYSLLVQTKAGEESGLLLGLNTRKEFSAKTNSINAYLGLQISNSDIPIQMLLGIRPEFTLTQHEHRFIWIDAGIPLSRYEMGYSVITGWGWLY